MVKEGHDDTQVHVKDTQQDRHLHLDRVGEREFRFCSVPDRIEAKHIRVSVSKRLLSAPTYRKNVIGEMEVLCLPSVIVWAFFAFP